MTEGIRSLVLIKKIGKQGGQGRDDGDFGEDLQYIKRKRIANCHIYNCRAHGKAQ